MIAPGTITPSRNVQMEEDDRKRRISRAKKWDALVAHVAPIARAHSKQGHMSATSSERRMIRIPMIPVICKICGGIIGSDECSAHSRKQILDDMTMES